MEITECAKRGLKIPRVSLGALDNIKIQEPFHIVKSRPTGVVVSDADCGEVGTGSESREDMDASKYIVSLRHGCTLNSHRAASPLVWLVEAVVRSAKGASEAWDNNELVKTTDTEDGNKVPFIKELEKKEN
ncbi:hypothetical protein TNCV_3379541 [Trichonephila clavipes]|nr:hypothetical protein TNCV_3379541 [Trichonephila clavipes]